MDAAEMLRAVFVGHAFTGTIMLNLGRGASARYAKAGYRVGLAVIAVLLGVANASAAANLQDWVGYWTGNGKIVLNNGQTEHVKCVVTYKVTGTQLKQNLRCAGQGYSLNGTADLEVTPAGSVTGSWTENTYSARGDVIGKTTDRGFSLSISGPTFTAVMDATTTACKQSLDIVPKGFDVNRISLGLAKC